MHATDLASRPPWLQAQRPTFAALDRDLDIDVAVIGGGLTGLATAYLLRASGQQVAVFEKGRLGGAESGHTTAHLTYITDDRLRSLVKAFGPDVAAAVWRSGAEAIDAIESIVHQESIDCQFQRVPGFLMASLREQADEREELREEAETSRTMGFDTAFVPSTPAFDRPAIRVANQAEFHPLKYLAGLARAVSDGGGRIYEQSELTQTDHDSRSLKINGHTVRFQHLMIATHVPLTGLSGLPSAMLLQSKLASYSSYVLGAKAPPGTAAAACYWDTTDPYYYLRVNQQAGFDYLIFGGEDHRTGQRTDAESRYASLESLLRRHFPEIEIDHRWSGQVIATNDGLPYIGEISPGQFVATGFNGNGITFGTTAALMACDWVLGRDHPYSGLFDVNRTKLRGGTWNYITQNLGFPYYLARGYILRADVQSVDDIGPHEGRIAIIDGRRCAAFRSPDGTLSVRSAICTHLGCVVRWNQAEQTWDCPCHGSRFSTEGDVIAGPAEAPLSRVPDQ